MSIPCPGVVKLRCQTAMQASRLLLRSHSPAYSRATPWVASVDWAILGGHHCLLCLSCCKIEALAGSFI